MFLQSYIYWKARTLAEFIPSTVTSEPAVEYADEAIRYIATDLSCAVREWRDVFQACPWHGDDYSVWEALLAKLEILQQACSNIERTHDLSTALSFCTDGRIAKAIPDMEYRRWPNALEARVLLCDEGWFVTQPQGLSTIRDDSPRRALAAYTNAELEYLTLGFVQVRNRITEHHYCDLSDYNCSWSYAQVARCCLNNIDPLSSVLLCENDANEVMHAIWYNSLRIFKKHKT